MFTTSIRVLLVCLVLFAPNIVRAQYDYFSNGIVILPPVPVAKAPNDVGRFTVVVPLKSVRFINDTFVKLDIQPDVQVTYRTVPPSGGTINIRIAYSTIGGTFTGMTYDVTGVPVLITVNSPGSYTINYLTKNADLGDNDYVLRLSTTAVVVSSASGNQFQVENPQPNSVQSGIGVISGWACAPSNLTVRIDGNSGIRVPGGGGRLDTTGVCGHSSTGFGLLVNYNELKSGPHTIRLESSDPSFVSQVIPFTVVVPGGASAFLSGLNKDVSIPGFPVTGKATTLSWQESLQNFSIRSVQ